MLWVLNKEYAQPEERKSQMQLTERHIIKSTEHRFAQIDELAFKSKNLYNAANYVIRQNFIYGWGYVNYNLVAKQIGTLVVGKNAQWKTEIELGKQTNQNFVTIPHSRLIEMLEYKARLVGITVIVQEESYSSRANFLCLDPIPVYGKTDKEPVFTGKRIKRGLYKTSVGQLINSDVNGSYNILRKAFPLCVQRWDRSWA